jgi:hypothetical protein
MREDATDPMNWFDEQDIEAMYDRPLSSLDTVLQNDPDWFTKGGEAFDQDPLSEPDVVDLDEDDEATHAHESAHWQDF